ncbi:peptide ABC transporter permease, partial [Aeromonas molluscorum 848]
MLLYILRRISLLLITLLALTVVAYLLDYRLLGQQPSFWGGYPDFLRHIFEG